MGLSLFILGYTYVGYPVVLGLLARLFPQAVGRTAGYQPRVTVCLPAYNAAAFIDAKLASLVAQSYPRDKLEILVYSDGSTDETDARVESWSSRHPEIRLLRGPGRRGKPEAINQVRAAATGEVILLNDARQPLSPNALSAMLSLLADPQVGIVGGNLVLEGSAGSGVYWKYENWIRRQEARFRSVVGVSGSIALLRTADLVAVPGDIILDDVWIPMQLRLQKRKVLFCEEAHAYDQAFQDDREFGRKVRTLAGNFQLFARMPRLLLPFANPSWFETISHKVMRLVCPWVLLLLLVTTSLGLASGGEGKGMMALLVVMQLAFYAAALVGRRGGRLAGVARTFVVMNAAAMVGLWRFVSGRQRITW